MVEKIPEIVKQRIKSASVDERISCAGELINYPGKESVCLLIELLYDEQQTVVNAAENSIRNINTPHSISETITLLYSENVKIRNLAVEILSKIGSAAISTVSKLINDPNSDVRKFAVDILERIHDPNTEDSLIHALLDENINVASQAAIALGKIRSKPAVPFLIDCLKKESWLKICAIQALGEIDRDEALDALLEIKMDDEPTVIFTLVVALGKIRSTKSIDYLIHLYNISNASINNIVIQAFDSIISNASEKDIEIFKQKFDTTKITNILNESNNGTKRSIIHLLGICKEEMAIDTLAKLLNESNEELFDDIQNAITNIGITSVKPFINTINDKDEPESVKIAILNLLKNIEVDASVNELMPAFHLGTNELKINIIKVFLTDIQDEIPDIIFELLKTENDEVKIAIISTLTTVNNSKYKTILLELLNDQNEDLQITAAISLSKFDLTKEKSLINDYIRSENIQEIKIGIKLIPKTLIADFEDVLISIFHNKVKVRNLVINKLRFLNSKPAFELIVSAINNNDESLRLTAIKALGNYSDKKLDTILKEILSSEKNEWNKYQAIILVGKLKYKNLLPLVISEADNKSDLLIAGMLDLIGDFCTNEHKHLIEKYMHSKNPLLLDAAVIANTKIDNFLSNKNKA